MMAEGPVLFPAWVERATGTELHRQFGRSKITAEKDLVGQVRAGSA